MSTQSELKEIVERMSYSFPWYDPELDGNSGNEGIVLEKLPLMTASKLETHYYTADNPMEQINELNRYRTSGTSSNRRKTIFYSESDEAAYLGIKLDVFRAILGTGGFRTAMADMGTGHAEATAVDVFRRLGMEVESLSFRLPVEQHIERLKDFQPEVLYTMPSILERILLASEEPASYGIRHVILVGEIASPGWMRRAAERLGIGVEQITDTYGSIEIGTIAYFSHEHGRYVVVDGLIAEGISAEGLGADMDPLPDEEQVLVLTSMVRDSFPALRYVTYDVVRDLRPIVVEGTLRQSFQSIVKRIGPDLKHGEKISIYDIEDVVYRHLGDASVRVKVAGNALRVYVYGSQVVDPSLLERVRSDLEERTPEIGMMIRSGILEGIQVIGSSFDDSLHRSSVKHKKIVYE
ncbi:CoF synthetase [Paenibacillus sp. SI8]|uniref:CoF synthetase n=1 Tax=unclassified Paenibacillus TaxID=185978 RepID=UPI00346647F5